MNKKDGGNFIMGLMGGVIFGSLIDNMAIGILLGLAVGFGIIKLNRSQS